MIKIKNLNEAKLMNTILEEMILSKSSFNQIPHNLNISYDYFQSIIKKITEYSDYTEHIIDYSNSEDYYNFRKIHELDEFMNNGGFEKIYNDFNADQDYGAYIKSIETKNLILENESFEYQRQIREQEQRIRNMSETDLKLSLWQKYWWLISGAVGVLGYFLNEILR